MTSGRRMISLKRTGTTLFRVGVGSAGTMVLVLAVAVGVAWNLSLRAVGIPDRDAFSRFEALGAA